MKRIFLGLLFILWAVTIFAFSHQPAEKSSNSSQGTIRIFLKVIVPNEPEKEQIIERVEPVVRKLAHYFSYLLGGILIYLFLDSFYIGEKGKILGSQMIGTFYAITDEIHQWFILGRACQISDVFLDSLGIITGILLVILIKKIL